MYEPMALALALVCVYKYNYKSSTSIQSTLQYKGGLRADKGGMGVPKSKWTSAEEEALRGGIAKYGAGKWRNIKADTEFTQILISRSNIDLKVLSPHFLYMYGLFMCTPLFTNVGQSVFICFDHFFIVFIQSTFVCLGSPFDVV